MERFWSKVQIGEPDGCWLWKACLTPQGYGRFHWRGRSVQAHRVAYELAVGPIPEGCELDHVRERGCVHRHCVNPAHLEPVTPEENKRRQDIGKAARINAAKTHCVRGHEFTPENTYRRPGSEWRECRTCRREGTGYQGGQRNSEKTHCPRGHAYDEANTGIVKGGGHRYCRRCQREAARARRVKAT